MKFRYKVYGLNIESEIELSELIKLEDEKENIDVSISYGKVPGEIKEKINHTTCVGISKDNICVYVKDIAIYQVTNGNRIIIDPLEDKNNVRIKSFLLGWSFGVLFVQRNTIALHGATIAKGNRAITIVGNSGSGKSSLASEFMKKGYKFLSDDVAPIENKSVDVIIHPAYPQQKLCKDTIDNLGYDVSDFEVNRQGNERERYKVPIRDIFIDKSLPLEAIFEIEASDVDFVEIEEVKGSDKIDCFLDNIYFFSVERNSGTRKEYFKQCLDVVSKIPMYKVKRPNGKYTVGKQIELIESIL